MKYGKVLLSSIVAVAVFISGCGASGAESPNYNTAIKATESGITYQQLQSLYQAIQSVPATSTAYVNAYMNAIVTRSGLYARGYLDPSIRNQIPARIIGSSKWIGKWTITPLITHGGKGVQYSVSAYAYIPGKTASQGTWMGVFTDVVTLNTQNLIAPPHNFPPFIITAQKITWTNITNWDSF